MTECPTRLGMAAYTLSQANPDVQRYPGSSPCDLVLSPTSFPSGTLVSVQSLCHPLVPGSYFHGPLALPVCFPFSAVCHLVGDRLPVTLEDGCWTRALLALILF